MRYKHTSKPSDITTKLKSSVWSIGVLLWLSEFINQSTTSFVGGYLSAIDTSHLFIASCLFIGWLYLKPKKSLSRSNVGVLESHQLDSNSYQGKKHTRTTQTRMLELREQHMISQEYTLPFPYLCQIYHLLNLKHLEKIHNFSLNNLKVAKVDRFQPTASGGAIKFKTVLDSPVNTLRVWRQPIVEVGLTLHTPYTVELSIPVYNNKNITVIFNVLPLSNTEHKLFIDIYSNLAWPKLFLQVLLHLAACLTLLEDFPYLRRLSERSASDLVNSGRISNHETVWLFRRFVDLYGSDTQPDQPFRFQASEDTVVSS